MDNKTQLIINEILHYKNGLQLFQSRQNITLLTPIVGKRSCSTTNVVPTLCQVPNSCLILLTLETVITANIYSICINEQWQNAATCSLQSFGESRSPGCRCIISGYSTQNWRHCHHFSLNLPELRWSCIESTSCHPVPDSICMWWWREKHTISECHEERVQSHYKVPAWSQNSQQILSPISKI
jgi:hypothetical protein